jgi:hypothetical protein
MALFNWFSNKPRQPVTGDADSSRLSRVEAAQSITANTDASVKSSSLAPGSAANRKPERPERREMLYAVVRECMTQAGVLSSSYKFKVLSLDSRGRQYLVMMDLPQDHDGDTGRLAEIEALIARNAKSRHDLLVTAVYWRVTEPIRTGLNSPASAAPVVPKPDFAGTEVDAPPSPLSRTQYGDLS